MRSRTRPGRWMALAMVLSMGGGLAVLSANSASAVPAAPTIAYPPSGAELVSDTVEIAGTIVEDGTDQIVRVWVEDSEGLPAGDCNDLVLSTESVFFCFVGPLADGDYTAYADSLDFAVPEGDASAPSPLIEFTIATGLESEITNWSGAENEWETFQPVMAGTGPALGSVTVEMEFIDPSESLNTQTETYCTAAVDGAGSWSCAGPPLSIYTNSPYFFTPYGEDAAGAPSPPVAPSQIGGYVVGVPPDVVLDLVPGGVDATVTALDGLVAYAEWYSVELDGEDTYAYGPPDARCPADATSPQEASARVELCSYRNLTPGIWNLLAGQLIAGDVLGAYRDDYILIPETPALTEIETSPGRATLRGTGGAPGDLITVSTVGGQGVCSATVSFALTWTCAADRPVGTARYRALAQSTGFVANPPQDYGPSESYDGFSSYSPSRTATVPARSVVPSLDYEFTPASISATATGEPNALIGVELWSAEPNGEGYDFDFIDSCGDLSSGSGDEGGFLPESAPFGAASVELDCDFDRLSPGIWNIYYAQSIDGNDSPWADDYVRIPETPVFEGAALLADRSVRFTGSGTPGYRIYVRSGSSDATVCSATVVPNGTWSCTATPPAGTASYRAVQESVGFVPEGDVPYGGAYDGLSALTVARTVVVPPAPVPPAPAPPAPTPAPAPAPAPGPPAPALLSPAPTPVTPGTVQLSGLPDTAGVGTQLEISGITECVLPIICDVAVDIFSTPQRLGETITDPEGAFGLVVSLPQSLEPGEHTIAVTVTPRGGEPFSVSQPILIASADASEPSAGAPDDGNNEAGAVDGARGASGVSGTERDSLAEPSALTGAIPTLAEIFRSPIVTVTAGGIALAILLLVAFPTELLNSTLSANTRRFGRGFARFESGVDRVTEWFAEVTRTRAAAAAILVLVTSVVFGFVDPS